MQPYGKMISPLDMKVKEGRHRQHFDKQKMEDLKASLLLVGQLQPVLVDGEGFLIAGERRVRACLDLSMDVWVCQKEELDPLMIQEMELAENIYRSDLTSTEQLLAEDKLHALRAERF